VFTDSSAGIIVLSGDDQKIEGSFSTTFPSLSMQGNNTIKEVSINTFVDSILDINNSNVETYNHVLTLKNSDPNGLVYIDGFISSELAGGYFSRATSSNEKYIFPLGSYQLNDIYRPIEIQPSINENQYFHARLAALDPSDDMGNLQSGIEGPFPRTSFANPLNEINPNYYFNIYNTTDPNAIYHLHYFEQDGDFSTAAHWNPNLSKWEKTFNSILLESDLDTSFNLPEFVMSMNKSDIGSEVISLGSTTDLFYVQLITPNGDLRNDYFHIEGAEDRDRDHLKIFNRWGATIFESDDYKNEWNGEAEKGLIPLKQDSPNGFRVPTGAYFFEYKPQPDEDFMLSGYFHVHY
jgi:gliding motility-associated-like protein